MSELTKRLRKWQYEGQEDGGGDLLSTWPVEIFENRIGFKPSHAPPSRCWFSRACDPLDWAPADFIERP